MDRNRIELDIKVPNQTRYLSLIGKIGEDLAQQLEREGGGQRVLAQHMNVVLTEAMTNAIRHAHEGDPDKTVHISISLTDEELWIRVYDEGQGFDLNAVPAPDVGEPEEHGHGIYIIKCLMDTVVYRRSHRFNVLEMWKKLR